MANYTIALKILVPATQIIQIEAKNEKQAKEKAWNLLNKRSDFVFEVDSETEYAKYSATVISNE